MTRTIAMLLVCAGFFSLSRAQNTLSQEVRDNIALRVKKGTNIGIVVGIADGDEIYYYSCGMNGGEPLSEHSVFEIGSVTKTFTGIILATKVIEGKMKLDDPLQNYLPEGVTAPARNGAPIRLIHLANHTSSLPRMPDNFSPANPANPYADYSEKQLYEFLNSYMLTRDIGSQYEYSNYGAGLLGHVMASEEGVTYEELMVDVVARPLGLNDTRITLTRRMNKHLATGHHNGVQVENWSITTLAGAGAIRSTAADLLKYICANMGKGSRKLYSAMQLSHVNSRPQGVNPRVGLGWHITVSDTLEIVWHNGGTGGYRTFAGFVKNGDRGVVVLTNSTASVDDIGMHLLDPKVPLKVYNAFNNPPDTE